jgi:hypothetical protein
MQLYIAAGGLVYLTISRPDIAYAVHVVSKFENEPRSVRRFGRGGLSESAGLFRHAYGQIADMDSELFLSGLGLVDLPSLRSYRTAIACSLPDVLTAI